MSKNLFSIEAMHYITFRSFWVAAFLLLGLLQGYAITYTVNSTADFNTGTGTNGTLRYCINQANAVAGPHTIQFSVAGTITLSSDLPIFNQVIFIDGATAPGYVLWTPTVSISGFTVNINNAASAGSRFRGLAFINPNPHGFVINSVNNITIEDCFIGTNGTADLGAAAHGILMMGCTGTTIKRSVISGNNAHGILVQSSPSTIISGNYIGCNKTGAAAIANSAFGILLLDASNNCKIGGITSDSMNVISGNSQVAVGLQGAAKSNIRIVGNRIGVTAAGNAALGNQFGVHDPSSTTNGLYILKNVISGCSAQGIYIEASTNVVIKGNYLGTNAAGTTSIVNIENSIDLNGTHGTIIGGAAAGEGNVIAGSGGSGKHGIILQGGSRTNNCVIKGNYVGTNASGTAITGVGIQGYGIVIKGSNNVIGGLAAGERNIVAGVAQVGILLTDGSNNSVVGNYIGVDISKNALGNGYAGVMIRREDPSFSVQNNVITNNVIAYNGYTYPVNPTNSTWVQPNRGPGIGVGVAEYGTSNTDARFHRIRDNEIYCNAGLGISLNRNETTPGYGNNNKAAPVINSGTSSNTDTYGTALPGDEIQVFANPTNCGTCQGEILLGTVTADGAGNWSLTGHANYYKGKITAYARDASNNTSEFSICTDPTLPVQWTSFTATRQAQQEVLLQWTVATQLNNDYFTVEKSEDGIHFYSIAVVDGEGSLPSSRSYSVLDMHFTQTAYYRLKQTDFDGHSSYSLIRLVAYSASAAVNLFPNPAQEMIHLTLDAAEQSTVLLVITNALGQIVATHQWENVSGNTTQSLDVSGLPGGLYIASVTVTGQPVQTVKIIIE